MDTLKLHAYAKLNLGLRVRGGRPDGYHEIESVLQTIDLADHLTITKRHLTDIRVDIRPDVGINPHDNLVARAARRLQRHTDVPMGAEIHLAKGIPIGAGLGGGSSDAAATLIGLNRLWGLDLSRRELDELALALGSDVPFFLHGGRCHVRGRGERVEPLDDEITTEANFLLLIPPWSLRTIDVYNEFDQLEPSSHLESSYPNDLEAAALALEPRLATYRDWLASHDLAFGLSGSGPVYFVACDDPEEANGLADAARTALTGRVRICRPTSSGQLISGIDSR